MLGAVLLVSSLSAAADALTVLNDAAVFARVQKDVAEAPRADLDALAEAVTTCAAVSIGQRPQQFDCERGVNLYWTRYNRGRSLDDYMGAVGGLFAAFDNNALNPTQEMSQTYRHVSSDLVSLMKTINKRYRQLDK
jgi:hypothetical protein